MFSSNQVNVNNDEGDVTSTTTKQEIPVNGEQNVSKMEKTISTDYHTEISTKKLNPTNLKMSKNLREEASNKRKISEINNTIIDIKIKGAMLNNSKSIKIELKRENGQSFDSTDQTTEEQELSKSGLQITDISIERNETTKPQLEVIDVSIFDLIKKNMEEYNITEVHLETVNTLLLSNTTIKKLVAKQEHNTVSTSKTCSSSFNSVTTYNDLKRKLNIKTEVNDQNRLQVGGGNSKHVIDRNAINMETGGLTEKNDKTKGLSSTSVAGMTSVIHALTQLPNTGNTATNENDFKELGTKLATIHKKAIENKLLRTVYKIQLYLYFNYGNFEDAMDMLKLMSTIEITPEMLKKNTIVVEVISVATEYNGNINMLTLSDEQLYEHVIKIFEIQCEAKKVFATFMALFNVTDVQRFKKVYKKEVEKFLSQ